MTKWKVAPAFWKPIEVLCACPKTREVDFLLCGHVSPERYLVPGAATIPNPWRWQSPWISLCTDNPWKEVGR